MTKRTSDKSYEQRGDKLFSMLFEHHNICCLSYSRLSLVYRTHIKAAKIQALWDFFARFKKVVSTVVRLRKMAFKEVDILSSR